MKTWGLDYIKETRMDFARRTLGNKLQELEESGKVIFTVTQGDMDGVIIYTIIYYSEPGLSIQPGWGRPPAANAP